MRIFSENTESYIQSLAAAIDKDPASFENWCCLHIAQTEETPFALDSVLHALKKVHGEVDCDAVLCRDNDVLLISRSLGGSQLYELAEDILQFTNVPVGKQADTALYDVFYDWRTVRELLLAKTAQAQPPVAQSSAHNFGDISALLDVFAEAKKLRKSRLPLHVLLVEDDPLTRRLVTGTFKEQYALITATNAEEAVASYLLHAPDIVFLDIGLPDASGLDVLHSIMETDSDAYVVMFSGNSYLDNVTAALGKGASGFVSKPFKKEKMRHYIQDSALHHHKYA